MTQELYQKAMKFAGEKHGDQKVPGTNASYLLHLSNVAMEVIMAHKADSCFDLNFAVQMALLHDVIEDTDTDFEEIEKEFGNQVAVGVMALTKNEKLSSKEEKMKDTLNRINSLAKEVGIVKLADRITNLQAPPRHWSKEKANNYLIEAKLIAKNLEGKNDFLETRIHSKILAYREYL